MNTLRPFAMNMTQAPIGSRKHHCPRTTMLSRGATIDAKLIFPPCGHGDCLFGISLQRDCQTTRTTGKRCPKPPTQVLDSHGRKASRFGYACFQQLQKEDCLRGLCRKCVLTSLETLCQHTATGAKVFAFPKIARSHHYDYTCEYLAMHWKLAHALPLRC